jgi:hypothetical protein
MDKAAVYVGMSLLLLAGVLAVKMARLQHADRHGPKNPNRVPFQAIKARVEHERVIEWPTASHLQRHGEQMLGRALPAVRVPPYVLSYLAPVPVPAPRQAPERYLPAMADLERTVRVSAHAA